MNHSITDARGRKCELPKDLHKVRKLLAARAALARKEKRLEQELGTALSPILKELVKRGDSNDMAECANAVTETGSFNGRFFFEKLYLMDKAVSR